MIRQYVDEDQISIFIDDGLKLEYNINAGTEHDDFLGITAKYLWDKMLLRCCYSFLMLRIIWMIQDPY